MEKRANYKAVGGYVLGFIILMILFVVWVAGVGFHHNPKTVNLIFNRVSGLKEGAQVKYQGVPIGQVTSIRINPKNPQEIMVLIDVDPAVPIKKDAQAFLEQQGLTGVSNILLSGGTPEAPELRKERHQDYPTIYGKVSQLDKAIDTAPGVLNDISSLTTDIKDVVSHDNREAIRDILFNVKELTEGLKTRGGDEETSLGEDLATMIRTAQQTLGEVQGAAREIRLALQENRGSVKNFAGPGLTSLTKLIADMRDTFMTYKRIGESIERSPGRFFHNDPEKGVRLK